jgi:hypothetical protein
MKPKTYTSVFVIFPLLFALSSCSWQGAEGIITINLGAGTSARAAAYPPTNENGILSELELRIQLEGPAGTQNHRLPKGVTNASFTVAIGRWVITVEAWYEGERYATGSGRVDVKAGQRNTVTIQMSYAGGGTVAVTGVTLHTATLNMVVGNTATLIATVSPDNADNKTVTWSSGNPAVATVSDGVVTAVSAGTATITVTTEDGGRTAECAVTVFTTGGGTPANPFIVYGITTLQKVGTETGTGWTLDAHYRQIADINLSSAANWTPIGDNTDPFNGNYNGGGYAIENLTIDISGQNIGLFGYIHEDGVVEKLGLINATISGQANIGAVAGTNMGTIQNCYVSGGSVSGKAAGGSIGGVAGYNDGAILNCYTTASVSGAFPIGGVVGNNSTDGTVKNCVALNQSVECTTATATPPTPLGRIAGQDNSTNGLANNYADKDMPIWDANNPQTATNNKDDIDGEDIIATDWNNASWWIDGTNFDPALWDIADNRLPLLNKE